MNIGICDVLRPYVNILKICDLWGLYHVVCIESACVYHPKKIEGFGEKKKYAHKKQNGHMAHTQGEQAYR